MHDVVAEGDDDSHRQSCGWLLSSLRYYVMLLVPVGYWLLLDMLLAITMIFSMVPTMAFSEGPWSLGHGFLICG